jgi:hypothetical protein
MTELEKALEELEKAKKYMLAIETVIKLKTKELRKAQEVYTATVQKYTKLQQEDKKKDE